MSEACKKNGQKECLNNTTDSKFSLATTKLDSIEAKCVGYYLINIFNVTPAFS